MVELAYMSLTIFMASRGNPRSSIMASSHAWSMDPKALRKSMYAMHISLVEYFASSKVATRICIWRVLFHCGRKLSWL